MCGDDGQLGFTHLCFAADLCSLTSGRGPKPTARCPLSSRGQQCPLSPCKVHISFSESFLPWAPGTHSVGGYPHAKVTAVFTVKSRPATGATGKGRVPGFYQGAQSTALRFLSESTVLPAAPHPASVSCVRSGGPFHSETRGGRLPEGPHGSPTAAPPRIPGRLRGSSGRRAPQSPTGPPAPRPRPRPGARCRPVRATSGFAFYSWFGLQVKIQVTPPDGWVSGCHANGLPGGETVAAFGSPSSATSGPPGASEGLAASREHPRAPAAARGGGEVQPLPRQRRGVSAAWGREGARLTPQPPRDGANFHAAVSAAAA